MSTCCYGQMNIFVDNDLNGVRENYIWRWKLTILLVN